MDNLVSTDRCDRCGSQAYVRFIKDLMELDFCGHHAGKYDSELENNGWSISIDTRELLTRREVGVS
jgi:hypothetical protein